MKRLFSITYLIFLYVLVFSQGNDTIYRTYNDVNELNRIVVNEEVSLYKYVDSTFSYEVNIPEWLTLRETGNPEIWGGTLPAVEGIENAIVISGFHKATFRSFDAFKEKYLTGNKFGQQTLYSTQHIWYGQNKLIEIENGVRQKVFTLWNNGVYHNEFVLIETPTAYLWIQFASTPDTYDMIIQKFEDLMDGFKVIE